MQNTKTNRNSAISICRITGMTFIVLCHIILYYTFIPMHQSLGQFLNCGVILFLFISGYLYGGKTINDFKKWYFKRIVSIAVPAILISILTIAGLFIAGEQISINSIVAYCLDLEGLLFLNWQIVSVFFKEVTSLGPLWFTTIIMICYLLVPILQKVSKSIELSTKFLILLFLIGSIVSIIISNHFSIFYFVIFATGYFAKKIDLLERINLKFVLIYSILFVCAISGRLLLQTIVDGTFIYSSYVTISHFFVGTWFVVIFAYLNNKYAKIMSKIADSKVARTIDSYSFYVYLTHGIFCMGKFDLFVIFPLPAATVLFLICTITSSIALKYLSNIVSESLLKVNS